MMPAWLISLLSINGVEEFSFTYNEEQKIFIDGKRINGEWIINMYVSAMPYVVWGFQKFNTKLRGSHKEVISLCLTDVLNRLSVYPVQGKDKIYPY